MRHAVRLFSLTLIGLLALPAQAASRCERLVATGDSNQPPYLWVDPAKPGQLVGLYADLAQRIGAELGVDIRLVESGDAARAGEEVASGRADLLLGVTPSLDDLQRLDVFHPALYLAPQVVLVKADSSFPFAGWNDLRGRRGLRPAGVAFDSAFEGFARANLELSEVASLDEGLDQLRLGRTQYLIADRQAAVARIAALGFQDAVQALDWPVTSRPLHLALSHSSACNDPALRGQLAVQLRQLAESGLADGLLRANLQRWKGQLAPVVEIESPQE